MRSSTLPELRDRLLWVTDHEVPLGVVDETARVVVLTRQGCHLCDQAIEVVAAVCAETGDSYVTQDVEADPELVRRYTDQVPVTFVDGAQHDFWRVDPERLRAALQRPG
jgi:glutaredoxin